MYRRTGLVLFVIFGIWAAWMFPKEVTYVRGKSIDYGAGTVETIYVHCGDALPILQDGVFADGVPNSAFYMKGECVKAARSHIAWVVILGAAALTFLIVGLVRGKAPRVPAIDAVLKRLPTPEQMREPYDAPV
ncbi:MAG: hypothetical protein MUP76_10840 [Acidimicrobiia bacterium]|nr:hypothetical protein [Acidimicrobiia bacterium]